MRRWMIRIALGLLGLLLIAVFAAWVAMRASLPTARRNAIAARVFPRR